MSDRTYIRDDDAYYYAGHLWVEPNGEYGEARITWDAYGDYGNITLNLDADEARKLAAALNTVAGDHP